MTAGVDAALALAFILPESSARSPVPGGSAFEGPATVVPLTETSLSLVGTLLTFVLNTGPNVSLLGLRASEGSLGRAERLDRAPGNPVSQPEFPHGSRRDHRCYCDFYVRDDVLPIPWSGSRHGNRWDRRYAVSAPVPRRPTSLRAGQSLLTPGNKPAGTNCGRRRADRVERRAEQLLKVSAASSPTWTRSSIRSAKRSSPASPSTAPMRPGCRG